MGTDITCEGHEQLLKQTAIDHGTKLGAQPAKARRRVYEHNLEYYEPPDPGEELNIDSSINKILAYETHNNYEPSNPSSLMPKEAYLKLMPSAKDS